MVAKKEREAGKSAVEERETAVDKRQINSAVEASRDIGTLPKNLRTAAWDRLWRARYSVKHLAGLRALEERREAHGR